jgi:anti-anti-sigma factor
MSVFAIRGALTSTDTGTSLRRSVREAIEAGARYIVINLKEVWDIDSSGVAELASVHITTNSRGGQVVLCCLSKKVKHLFKITHLDEVFVAFETEDDATRST